MQIAKCKLIIGETWKKAEDQRPKTDAGGMKREEELRPEAPLPEGDCDNDYDNDQDVGKLQPGAGGLTPSRRDLRDTRNPGSDTRYPISRR